MRSGRARRSLGGDLIILGRAIRRGHFDVVDPAFERLTGRPPVAVRDVLLANRADLLAVG